MFYSRTFLARKSPLGTVWIAAHLQHKLRKSHIIVTDIATSVDCIMFPEVPIALRLSGHLLLGVVRIYSKKVDYLHHDCNEFLTQIRTAFASIQLNLPEDASHAPFHSITLPETLELDALDMDYAMCQADAPDDHLKKHDEITMIDQVPTEGDPYIAFFVNEEIRMDVSPPLDHPSLSSGPIEEECIPPPWDNGVDVTDPGPSNHVGESNQKLYEDHVPHDLPEIEVRRDAVQTSSTDNIPEWPDIGNNFVEQPEASVPTMNQKEGLSPIMEGLSVSGGESLPSLLLPTPPINGHVEEPELFELRNSLGPALPEVALQPTPPMEKKKPKSRKRKQLYDASLVLTNEFMKKQLEDTSKLVKKRKKLPLTTLDVWRSHKRTKIEQIFVEASISGMCADLQEVFKKSFIASKTNQVPIGALPKERVVESSCGEQAFDMEIEHPRFEIHRDGPFPEFQPSPSGREEFTPILQSNLGSVSQTRHTLEPEVFQTPELPTFAQSGGLEPETPIVCLEEQSFAMDTTLPQIPEILNSPVSPINSPREQHTVGESSLPKIPEMLSSPEVEELSFLNAEDTPMPNRQEESEVGSLSVRTRAVAQYLKQQSPTKNSKDPSGHFSLNKILEGKTRKQCARMFYETLVTLLDYNALECHFECNMEYRILVPFRHLLCLALAIHGDHLYF